MDVSSSFLWTGVTLLSFNWHGHWPASIHALSVCGLCSYLAAMEVSCPMKYGRVSQLSTKGWLSRTNGPFLLLPSSQEELLCFLAFTCIVLFPSTSPVTDPRTDNISYLVFIYLLRFLLLAKVLTPPFLKRFQSLLVTLVSIKLVTFVAIYPKRFV